MVGSISAATIEDEREPLKFSDEFGRKFSFPFNACRTWEQMQASVKRVFVGLQVIGPLVQDGLFDILDPNGDIVGPDDWDSIVR
ncbi:hypothetical protein B0T14DRAFT_435367, partial [Immersiella caudata]